MRLRETQQSYRERDNVLFTISECVLRTRHRAVQQSWISPEMPLPGYRDDRAIDFDDYLDRQPSRVIWQGPLESWENARLSRGSASRGRYRPPTAAPAGPRFDYRAAPRPM